MCQARLNSECGEATTISSYIFKFNLLMGSRASVLLTYEIFRHLDMGFSAVTTDALHVHQVHIWACGRTVTTSRRHRSGDPVFRGTKLPLFFTELLLFLLFFGKFCNKSEPLFRSQATLLHRNQSRRDKGCRCCGGSFCRKTQALRSRCLGCGPLVLLFPTHPSLLVIFTAFSGG